MDWLTLATLLARYGPGVVQYIQQKIQAGGPVKPEEITELLALVNKPGEGYFLSPVPIPK